jgi:hypothetical protein
MTVNLSIRAVIRTFAILIGAFIAIGIAMPLAASLHGRDVASATFHLLNVRHEGSIPSLFSSGLLAFAALLLFLIARIERARGGRDAGYWRLLAFVFVYLAIDETAQLHETLNRFHVDNAGLFAIFDRFPWVWFYTPLALGFAAAYGGFLLRLPRDTAIVFVVSGVSFVGGAIGIEIIGAHQIVVEHLSRDSLQYVTRGVIKEFFMYSGITLFIWCLLHRLRDYGEPIAFRFARPHHPLPPTASDPA